MMELEYIAIHEVKRLLFDAIQKATYPTVDEEGNEIPFTDEEKKAIKFALQGNVILDVDGHKYLPMIQEIPEGYSDHDMYKMVLIGAIRDGIKKDFLTRFGV